MDGPLCHNVPRLDQPDRFWLLPAPLAKWLGAGLFSGPLAAYLWTFWTGLPLEAAWSQGWLWAVWGLGLALSLVGAFVRPGGLHLGQWATVLVAYVVLPRRAVWRPVGRGILWW